MNNPLGGLERKVEQIIALCAELRAENHRLHDRVGELEEEKQGLAARMTAARERIESLMDRLPAE
jgi:cell division protein ZapB